MLENDLEVSLRTLTAFSERLVEILQEERQALVDRSLPALGRITDAKLRACADLEHAVDVLGPVPLRERIAELPESARAKLEPLHTRLIELARLTQEYNTVNGKIVRRSQQSVRELINLMSGKDTELLYGDQGHTVASRQGTAIARA
ncbi:MAG: flagellar protein FlgN [Pseudomonadales bacterium]